MARCSGRQTTAPGPANQGIFQPRFFANKRGPEPTFHMYSLTMHTNSSQTTMWTQIHSHRTGKSRPFEGKLPGLRGKPLDVKQAVNATRPYTATAANME